jgi:FtrD-like iron-sulfur protein
MLLELPGRPGSLPDIRQAKCLAGAFEAADRSGGLVLNPDVFKTQEFKLWLSIGLPGALSWFTSSAAIHGGLMRGRKRALKMTLRQTWPIWLTFALLFGLGAFGVWFVIPGSPPSAKVLAPGEDVRLAGSELQTGIPIVFALPLNSGDKNEFFIERGADNNIAVAFASCRKCYRSGHYRQGNEIYCGRCNEPMQRLSHGQTPPSEIDCTQIPIPFEKIGDDVVVRTTAVRDAFAQWYAPIVSRNRPENGRKMRRLVEPVRQGRTV